MSIVPNAIYLVNSGSRAYGTDTPDSDLDIRGVCIPPKERILGLHRPFEQYEDRENDTIVFGLHKFVNLAIGCNPNIIEILHARQQDIISITESGQLLRDAAPMFLSKQAFYTFGGYARQQLKLLQRTRSSRHGTHSDIVSQFGFDTKNAMHLIRLLRMGIEILLSGVVHTYRPDRAELLAIRNGAWSLEKIQAEAEELEGELLAAYGMSGLPERANFEAANRLVIDLVERSFLGRGV